MTIPVDSELDFSSFPFLAFHQIPQHSNDTLRRSLAELADCTDDDPSSNNNNDCPLAAQIWYRLIEKELQSREVAEPHRQLLPSSAKDGSESDKSEKLAATVRIPQQKQNGQPKIAKHVAQARGRQRKQNGQRKPSSRVTVPVSKRQKKCGFPAPKPESTTTCSSAVRSLSVGNGVNGGSCLISRTKQLQKRKEKEKEKQSPEYQAKQNEKQRNARKKAAEKRIARRNRVKAESHPQNKPCAPLAEMAKRSKTVDTLEACNMQQQAKSVEEGDDSTIESFEQLHVDLTRTTDEELESQKNMCEHLGSASLGSPISRTCISSTPTSLQSGHQNCSNVTLDLDYVPESQPVNTSTSRPQSEGTQFLTQHQSPDPLWTGATPDSSICPERSITEGDIQYDTDQTLNDAEKLYIECGSSSNSDDEGEVRDDENDLFTEESCQALLAMSSSIECPPVAFTPDLASETDRNDTIHTSPGTEISLQGHNDSIFADDASCTDETQKSHQQMDSEPYLENASFDGAIKERTPDVEVSVETRGQNGWYRCNATDDNEKERVHHQDRPDYGSASTMAAFSNNRQTYEQRTTNKILVSFASSDNDGGSSSDAEHSEEASLYIEKEDYKELAEKASVSEISTTGALSLDTKFCLMSTQKESAPVLMPGQTRTNEENRSDTHHSTSKVPSLRENTIVNERRFSERYPTFADIFTNARSIVKDLATRKGADISSKNSLLIQMSSSKVEVLAIFRDVLFLESSSAMWQETCGDLGAAPLPNLLWTWSRRFDWAVLRLVFQKVNHFQRSQELTSKHLLNENLKKAGHPFHDAMPRTFKLGQRKENEEVIKEYNKERRRGSTLWIMKEIGKSQGNGIKLIDDAGKISYAQASVIQKYVDNPLLLQDFPFKFDLRIYVLVTSFKPLEAFIYSEGFARFATSEYNTDAESIGNERIHLTNSSIQSSYLGDMSKNHPAIQAGSEGGGNKTSLKWLWSQLKQDGHDTEVIWNEICATCVNALLCVDDKIGKQPNSFELFGFDIMVDENKRPWLLEVNSSPSLAREHDLDIQVKEPLVSDTIQLVNPVPFNRSALAKICQRKIQEEKGTLQAKTNTKEQLEADLRAILNNTLPREYGEMPSKMGGFERLTPHTPD
jgi:hypothetical protein